VAARPKCCSSATAQKSRACRRSTRTVGVNGRVLSISSTVCIGTVIDWSVD
jgi:hypothetical protein